MPATCARCGDESLPVLESDEIRKDCVPLACSIQKELRVIAPRNNAEFSAHSQSRLSVKSPLVNVLVEI